MRGKRGAEKRCEMELRQLLHPGEEWKGKQGAAKLKCEMEVGVFLVLELGLRNRKQERRVRAGRIEDPGGELERNDGRFQIQGTTSNLHLRK